MASVSANPFATEYITLVAPYPPDECLQRIRDSIYNAFALPLSPNEMPLGGYFFGTRFTVFPHRKWHGNPGYSSIATGRVRANPVGGTAINLRVSLPYRHYPGLVGTPFFVAIVASVLFSSGFTSPEAAVGAIFCLLFAAAYTMIVVQLWRRRGERALLVETLARILNAQVKP